MSKRVVINRDKKKVQFSLQGQSHEESESHSESRSQSQVQQYNSNMNTKQIIKQRDYYKSKSEVYLIKCKFLSQKLHEQGMSSDIPNELLQQIQTVDLRMKKIQAIINQKRKRYLDVLKNKIAKLFHEIEFESAVQGLSGIQNQLDIMAYLMDMFRYRYNEMVNEMSEVDRIVEELKQETNMKNHNSDYIKEISKENLTLKGHIKQLQKQIFTINKSAFQLQKRGQQASQKSEQVYEHQIDQLEHQNQQLRKKIVSLEDAPNNKQIQIQKLKRIIDELQTQIKGYRVKIQLLQQDISMYQRQEYKWKSRFANMERQKDERILLLQNQIGNNQYLIDGIAENNRRHRETDSLEYQQKYYR